jgi:NAD(P)H-hydrate epimerase
MSRLLTSAQMREVDRRTIEEVGLPGSILMENAGNAAVSVLLDRATETQLARPVLVLAGPGNNGGDGFVVARRLLEIGKPVHVLLLGTLDRLRGDARLHAAVWVRVGGTVQEMGTASTLAAVTPGVLHHIAHAGVIVDALFGTGLTRPIDGMAAELITRVNGSGKPVLAIDLPSGVDADRGTLPGAAIRATWTVTFAAEKIGHRQYPGAGCCGEIVVRPIGIPRHLLDVPEHAVALNQPLSDPVAPRPMDTHKGATGHLVLLAGSAPGTAGAAVLAALGAARAGPGRLTVATHAAATHAILAHLPEAMTLDLPLPRPDGAATGAAALLVRRLVDTFGPRRPLPDAMAFGPGMGTDSWWWDVIATLLHRFDGPTVLDADALTVIAHGGDVDGYMETLRTGRRTAIAITPHPGEMARLTGMTTRQVQANRLEIAVAMAKRWLVWVVLKGAGTVIAAPDGRAWINATGNPGLAAGGSGDLLTGLLAGLLAQGVPMESATRHAVWLHGQAADQVAALRGIPGMLARDLLPFIRTP